nr:DUF4349 domain-containing protein [Hyphomonas sp. Mor2]
MSIRAILIGAGVLGLAACGGGGGGDYERAMAPPEPIMAEEALEMDAAPRMKSVAGLQSTAGDVSPEPDAGEAGPAQYIAYRHRLGLTLPKGEVDPLIAAHAEACLQAGPATCIVANTNVQSEDADYAYGSLTIRATPTWLETFMGGVESDTAKLGGEVTQRSTSAEDLTRQIVDTGARLEAQKTLQTRLLNLLERRDGELGELLQIERELARVTGQIESIEAQLKTLQLRVRMSYLDVNYQTKIPAFSGSRENPLGEAFGSFFYNLSDAIAAVITAFAFGLPWILLIALFLWIWLKLIWPRLRGKKKKPSAAS